MATKIVSDGVSKDSVIETLPDHSVARDIEAHAAWIEGLRVPNPTKGQPSVGCHNDGVKTGCAVPLLLVLSALVVGLCVMC